MRILRASVLTPFVVAFLLRPGVVFSAPVSNPHAHEAIGTVRQMYDGALTPDLAVNTFRNIDRLFPTRTVKHGARVYPLPAASVRLNQLTFQSGGKSWDLVDYLALNRVTGLLVLKDGGVALETYQLGNNEKTRWMSMSMAKSITSTLIGAALKQGLIQSLDDPVTQYVPKLVGSAYEGVSLRNVLMMSSGVRWNETYTDPHSDRRRLLDIQIAQQPGAAIDFMASLSRAAAAGTVNNYSTGETQIAGEVLHNAISRPLADYLSERIWARFGMEDDATWWLASPQGREIAGSGFSARLRDYGRFGLFILNNGLAGGEPILPQDWVAVAGSPKQLAGGQKLDYGYFWWPSLPTPDHPDSQGSFAAIGIFGQFLYVNPQEHLVIVVWSARSKPSGRDVIDDTDFFAAVAAKLHTP